MNDFNNIIKKVPKDGKWYTITLEVKWEGYTVITRNGEIIEEGHIPKTKNPKIYEDAEP